MKRIFISFLFGVACAISAAANPLATDALNAFRAGEGLGGVSYSNVLEKAALGHAQDMVKRGFFSHTGSDGSDIAVRATRAGYGWCWIAENIAKGQRDLSEVMNAWANSPGHRANMLSTDATEFALVKAKDNTWVMMLGRPGC